jgi:hypothetical protein
MWKVCNFYVSANIIRVTKSRRMRRSGHVACIEMIRNAYNVLVGKLEGKRPFGRARRTWEDNIIMDLRRIAWEGVDWIYLAQERDQ